MYRQIHTKNIVNFFFHQRLTHFWINESKLLHESFKNSLLLRYRLQKIKSSSQQKKYGKFHSQISRN